MLFSRYPSQIKYIVGNEACERFSFYGMRCILVAFMTQHLLMTNEDSTAIFHLFVSGAYLLPLLGAYLSDRVLGKYRTIMYASLLYCLGHATLAFRDDKTGLMIGLVLIAFGAGGVKPCVSAYVGDQFTSKNKTLIQGVFDIFYWAINVGAFFSQLIIPVVLKVSGPSLAFGIPGILMFLATIIFWMGRKQYVNVPPSGPDPHGFLRVFWDALKNKNSGNQGDFWSRASEKHPAEAIDGARAAFGIFKLFIMISGFWALYDQSASSWVLQAKQMNLHFLGINWEASQIQSLNSILLLMMIPVFAKVIYPFAERVGLRPTPIRRITAGMLLTALCFFIVALYQWLLDSGVVLSVGWHFIPFLLITAAEIMVSITGLEFAYTQAPKAMKSTIMSFWFLTFFFGNMLTAVVAKLNVFQGTTFFMFFAILMVVMTGMFMFAASRYKVVDRMADVNA